MSDIVHKLELLRKRCRNEAAGWANENVTVGDFTYGQPVVHDWKTGNTLTVGKFCSIGGNVNILLGGEHHTEWCTTYPFDVLLDGAKCKSKGDVVIGNDVWIGDNVTILSGVTIGNGAVIGAGSVVTKYVEPYTVVGGSPAKFIKDRIDPLDAVNLLIMEWWDWPLDKLVDAIPILTRSDFDGLHRYWQEVVYHE